MNKEYFIQRDVFLGDYKGTLEKPTISIDKLANQVLSQLDKTQEEYYTVSANDTKDSVSHRFPFSRHIYSDENDGILNTEYIYEGQPCVLETDGNL